MTGEELKTWRIKAGLTQAQLAEQLGVSSNTVARWERDEMSIPSHVNLAAISKSPQTYIRRVMIENGLNFRQVAERASKFGHRLGSVTVQMLLQGQTVNPGIYTVQALARGLGRPEEEVFAAFGVGVGMDKHLLRDPDLEAIQLNYAHLNPANRRQVKSVIAMLSREVQHLLSKETRSS